MTLKEVFHSLVVSRVDNAVYTGSWKNQAGKEFLFL